MNNWKTFIHYHPLIDLEPNHKILWPNVGSYDTECRTYGCFIEPISLRFSWRVMESQMYISSKAENHHFCSCRYIFRIGLLAHMNHNYGWNTVLHSTNFPLSSRSQPTNACTKNRKKIRLSKNLGQSVLYKKPSMIESQLTLQFLNWQFDGNSVWKCY